MTTNRPKSDTDSTMSIFRRTALGLVGAAFGLAEIAGATGGKAKGKGQGDGQIITRPCNDRGLDPDEWSTGALTVHGCPGSTLGEAFVYVTGKISRDRHPENPDDLGSNMRLMVDPGHKQTVWYTGTIHELMLSDDAMNIGIANRPGDLRDDVHSITPPESDSESKPESKSDTESESEPRTVPEISVVPENETDRNTTQSNSSLL